MVEVHLFNLCHSSSPSIFNTLEAFGARLIDCSKNKNLKEQLPCWFVHSLVCFDFIWMKVCVCVFGNTLVGTCAYGLNLTISPSPSFLPLF